MKERGTSQVVQWLRICLPTHGTQVQYLVWKDYTSRVTKLATQMKHRGQAGLFLQGAPLVHSAWTCACLTLAPVLAANEVSINT